MGMMRNMYKIVRKNTQGKRLREKPCRRGKCNNKQ